MPNPLISLKEKEHLHALYTVLIVIMLSVLFFLLTSLDSPLQKKGEEMEEEWIEIDFLEESFPSSEPKRIENESEPSVITSATITAPNPKMPVVQTADQSLGFTTGNNPEGNNQVFGISAGDEIKNTGERPLANLNRKIIREPSLNANTQMEGTIALKLWVDSNGEVIKSELNAAASNSGSQYLINLAKKAAQSMRYESKANVHTEFVGTQIFTFKKM